MIEWVFKIEIWVSRTIIVVIARANICATDPYLDLENPFNQ